MQRPFIVCQPEKCTGCQLCEFACSARHGGYNPQLSEIRLVRRQPAAIMAIACRMCDEPTCMYACPRECISVSETSGIMLVDKDVCNGCGWCVEACEFGAVSINHEERIVSMCNLCEDRGGEPRCVDICAYGALSLSTPADVAARRRQEIVLTGVLPEIGGPRRRGEEPAMKRMLLGNEAVALGAYAANVTVATGYPGTPSTEILERFARYPDVYAEWSPNEKVALEVGMGASLAGARVMVTMKHVGLNVAADPFFAAAYMGVEGGLVIVSADDPGMHSSQGEQDNRNYAKFAKVPLLEPSSSQECVDMMRIGMEISETFDTPVLLRTTTRVSHAQSLVDVDAEQINRPKRPPVQPFHRHPQKHVMLPAHARQQRVAMKGRLERLQEYAETTPLNHIQWGDRQLGIISHSMAYQYAREVFPQASFLKLGMAYPLPRNLIIDFASQVETLLIIEELDPYLEEQILALPDLPPMRVLGKEVFPEIGEFSPQLLARCALEHGLLSAGDIPFPLPDESKEIPVLAADIPARPPLLCAGCGHRGTFYILRQLMYPDELDIVGESQPAARNPYQRGNFAQRRQYGIVVNGDIGCYTLGALQPLFAMDTCGCMGASIGYALGMEKAGVKNKVVAVIGDSTFYHSGITGLVDVITSGAATTVIILDNYTTAMTGGNVNPGTGTSVDGQPARRVELETLCKGLGVEDVQVINAFDNAAIERELNRAVQTSEPSVLIVRAPCVLQERATYAQVSWVEADKCTSCWACLVTACPALIRQEGKVAILPDLCTDCEVCNQVCPYDAILRVERDGVKV